MTSRRLNIFAKGNVDVHDSLLFSTVAGTVQWNGINDIVRSRFPGHVVRIRHETGTRSDALLAAEGIVPGAVRERDLPFGPFSAESQFSNQVFSMPSQVVVLSILSDVMIPLHRHRRDGYLLYTYRLQQWPEPERHWVQENFENIGFLDVPASMACLARICQRLRSSMDAHILLYNASAVVPGEKVHCHAGLEDSLSTRIRRFNVAATELSQKLGISVVDVDRLVAQAGADRCKLDAMHLTAEGYRLVAEEVARILEDIGCFDAP